MFSVVSKEYIYNLVLVTYQWIPLYGSSKILRTSVYSIIHVYTLLYIYIVYRMYSTCTRAPVVHITTRATGWHNSRAMT